MPINLSIKNVPDDLAQRLRERAARNHRSVQGELMAILEGTVVDDVSRLGEERANYRAEDRLTASEILARARVSGIRTEGESAAEIIRRMRDSGLGRTLTGTLDVDHVMQRIGELGLKERDEAAAMIREDRNR